MGKMRTALGLMSGSSLDGVDVAIIVTDGQKVGVFGPTLFRPYATAERAVLRAAIDAAPDLVVERLGRPGILAEAEAIVTDAHAAAVEQLLHDAGLHASEIDIVGFHGVTVLHAPDRRLTVQIGDGPALARRLGIAVVHDFRAGDVARGGQGAPLAPAYHAALAARADLAPPVAVLNVAGIASVTAIGLGGSGDMVAFDTGPGTALIDDWCRARSDSLHDKDGALAARGRVDEAVLNSLLDNPYFDELPPKSLDRNAFALTPLARLSPEDGAATLTAFIAEAVAFGLDLVVDRPATIIISGGGARNPTLLAELEKRTGAAVVTAEVHGWAAEFVEAQAFAFLAVRHLEDLPLSFPATTGVPAPTLGGTLSSP